MRSDPDRVQDILEAIERIERHTYAGKTAFDDDDELIQVLVAPIPAGKGVRAYRARPDARRPLDVAAMRSRSRPNLIRARRHGPDHRSAASYTALYLRFPNYWRNLLRLGWTEDDIRDGGRDRLVDELVAWGDPSTIRKRVHAHLDAGADHVCVQVLTKAWGPPYNAFPHTEWRELADALTH